MSTHNMFLFGKSFSSGDMHVTSTVFTLSIGTPYPLSILVLTFEIVHSTTS